MSTYHSKKNVIVNYFKVPYLLYTFGGPDCLKNIVI